MKLGRQAGEHDLGGIGVGKRMIKMYYAKNIL